MRFFFVFGIENIGTAQNVILRNVFRTTQNYHV